MFWPFKRSGKPVLVIDPEHLDKPPIPVATEMGARISRLLDSAVPCLDSETAGQLAEVVVKEIDGVRRKEESERRLDAVMRRLEKALAGEGDDTKPCCMCNKEMESAMPDGDWATMQPIGGGEIILHFAFGSEKFDRDCEGACFNGVICDDCSETLMHGLSDISRES
jgi:hypothetical protein